MTLGTTTAAAAVVHDFNGERTKKISESAETCTGPGPVTGALGQVNALTVSPGEAMGEESHLWLAEQREQGFVGERVDQFGIGAATVKCEQQLEHAASLRSVYEGVAVGHSTGEREVYVGAEAAAGGETSTRVGAFGPTGKLQAIWTGEQTPNASPGHPDGFAESGGGAPGEPPHANVTDVAVDQSSGDVFVSTASGGTGVVDVFAPVAGGAEPAGVLAQLTGTCENIGEIAAGLAPCAVIPFEGGVRSIAVDPGTGDVLVASGRAVDVFEPTGIDEYRFVRRITETAAGHPFQSVIKAVAAGGGEDNGDIYVVEAENGTTKEGDDKVVYQFSSEGVFLGGIEGTPTGSVRGSEERRRRFGKRRSVRRR